MRQGVVGYTKSLALALTGLATLVALAGAALALSLGSLQERTRAIVPFSGGILLGVAAFDLFPELLPALGWFRVTALFAAGFALLLRIERFEESGWRPLLAVAAAHAFFDGWGISTAAQSAAAGIRLGVPVAVLLHKLPEGLSLGGMLGAALRSRCRVLGWCFLAESATLLGGAAGLSMTPIFGTAWISYPLAVAGGGFLYIGLHAIQHDTISRGARKAVLPALAGVAGSVAIQYGAWKLWP